MGKTLGVVLGLALFTGIATAQNSTEALKVGDRMPVFDLSKDNWELHDGKDSEGRFRGPMVIVDENGDGIVDGGQMYDAFCRNGRFNWDFPFIIYDLETKRFFVDNDITKSRNGQAIDGYIDQILEYTPEIGKVNPYKYAPECVRGRTTT